MGSRTGHAQRVTYTPTYVLPISAHFKHRENLRERGTNVSLSMPTETHGKDSSSQLLQLLWAYVAIKHYTLFLRSRGKFHSVKSELQSTVCTTVCVNLAKNVRQPKCAHALNSNLIQRR